MKGLRLKINCLSSSTVKVKIEWRYTFTPHMRFHGVDRERFMTVIGLLNKIIAYRAPSF
jgi:hypothetical protein